MGHANNQALNKLVSSDLATGIEKISFKDDYCEGCIAGKLSNAPIARASKDSLIVPTFPLQKIYLDTLTIGKPSYFHEIGSLIVTDAYSRYRFCLHYRTKKQVPELLMSKLRLLMNITSHRVEVVHCDMGTEFMNRTLERFFRKHGIRREYSAPHCPQQNGVAERSNRSLMDGTRALLLNSNLGSRFWTFALSTKVFTFNRTPQRLKYKGDIFVTPYQAFWKKKPDLSRLRIFGARGLGKRFVPNRPKLSPRAEPCIMLGYASNCRAYVVFWIHGGGIGTTRTIKLDEITFVKEINKNRAINNSPMRYESDTKKRDEIQSPTKDKTKGTEKRPKTRGQKQRANEKHLYNVLAEDEISEDESQSEEIDNIQENVKELTFKAKVNTVPPRHYYEATKYPDASEWMQAYNDEISSLQNIGEMKVVPRPKNKEILNILELFNYKYDAILHKVKHKVRIVVRGDQEEKFKQKENIYAPVANMDSIRLLFHLSNHRRFIIKQVDIKNAFLNGRRTDPIYISLPIGHPQRNANTMVWQTYTSVYGLRDAPAIWNKCLDQYLREYGMESNVLEPCMYRSKEDQPNLYAIVYVDDILFCGSDHNVIKNFENYLEEKFKIKTTGSLEKYVGFEIQRDDYHLKLHGEKYIQQLAEKFEVQNAKSRTTPITYGTVLHENSDKRLYDARKYQSILGGLQYVVNLCRPDAAFIVNYLTRYNRKPTERLYNIAKGVLIYLNSTREKGIKMKRTGRYYLKVFSDSDWGSDKLDRRSVSGYVIYYGNQLVSFKSKKQDITALSSMEAEFVALTIAIQHTLYIRRLLEFLKCPVHGPITAYIDNQSALRAFEASHVTKRSKYIDLRYHYLKQKIKREEVTLEYVKSSRNVADTLTKVVATNLFGIHTPALVEG